MLSASSDRGDTVPVTGIEPAGGAPIHFVLLVEVSEFTKHSKKIRPALEQSELIFGDLLPTHGGDVTAYAFDRSSKLLVDRTKDLVLLHEKLASLSWGKKTCLLDALFSAVQAVPQDGHRQIAIIVSNGEDDCSHTREKAVVKIARQKSVILYGLDTYFSFRRHNGSRFLEGLADATGGRLLFPADAQHVEQSFVQLRNDMSAQYWLSLGESVEKLKLKCRQKGVELLYPR
jgi:hypothetical protein